MTQSPRTAPQPASLNGTIAGSPYPPIADYAFLSDCEVSALIAPSGRVEWMCVPRMDGPSIFGAMLDRDAGGFRVSPAGQRVPTGRRYLPGTMILETTWGTSTGWVVCHDVLLIGPWHHDKERSQTHRRSPTDTDADHVLLRMMRCINGQVEMHVECEPRLDYGRRPVTWAYADEGYSHGIARAEGEQIELRLSTDLRLGFEGGRARARTTLREGDSAFVALTWTEHEAPTSYDDAYRRMDFTADFWHDWLSHGTFPDHPWRQYLERSALTLKGLTYAPTGAMCAAATTSLPEAPGGERNWDYRYSWIRDSTFMLWGLYSLGFAQEAGDYYYFIEDVASGDRDLQIMYGIGGEHELPESTLDHLEGYEHAKPVRIGNGAYNQDQHDVWGALLDSFYIHTKNRDQLLTRVSFTTVLGGALALVATAGVSYGLASATTAATVSADAATSASTAAPVGVTTVASTAAAGTVASTTAATTGSDDTTATPTSASSTSASSTTTTAAKAATTTVTVASAPSTTRAAATSGGS